MADLLDFRGRVAIVTGAGQGMGREHAKMLASRGARVVANDVNAERVNETVDEITAAGGTAVANSNDVVAGATAIVQTAIDSFGQLDIVVNNAGVITFGKFWEQDSDEWWRTFDVSFRGLVEVSRAAMPHLIASGTGRIINVSSNGVFGVPLCTAYNSAKAAVWGLGLSLADEAREVGVQVTTLMPVAWTAMPQAAFTDPVVRDGMANAVPAGAPAAFVTWLAHQDTTVHGDTFEIAGVAAGRVAAAGAPRVRVAEATPESWAANADLLTEDGTLRQFRNASESLRDQLTYLAPELDSVLPKDTASVAR